MDMYREPGGGNFSAGSRAEAATPQQNMAQALSAGAPNGDAGQAAATAVEGGAAGSVAALLAALLHRKAATAAAAAVQQASVQMQQPVDKKELLLQLLQQRLAAVVNSSQAPLHLQPPPQPRPQPLLLPLPLQAPDNSQQVQLLQLLLRHRLVQEEQQRQEALLSQRLTLQREQAQAQALALAPAPARDHRPGQDQMTTAARECPHAPPPKDSSSRKRSDERACADCGAHPCICSKLYLPRLRQFVGCVSALPALIPGEVRILGVTAHGLLARQFLGGCLPPSRLEDAALTAPPGISHQLLASFGVRPEGVLQQLRGLMEQAVREGGGGRRGGGGRGMVGSILGPSAEEGSWGPVPTDLPVQCTEGCLVGGSDLRKELRGELALRANHVSGVEWG